jgi:iron complex outermembrane receptor protein
LLKVFSASQQQEPLSETPVPVTVITSEMIRAIGARNLQDVLITYVPGMTLVADHNEMNVAMHGVYASSQQKILVLLDGHRLNSRAYSMANPDFSISLDKVRQIEVLRGPGSSLYGNVALTAVINIVTKSGREADGLTLRVGAGNYRQRMASLLFGRDFDNGDVLAWATGYSADGEARFIPQSADNSPAPRAGYAILGGARDPASYDIGSRLKIGAFSFLINLRQGKLSDAFTAGGSPTGRVFDYHAQRTIEGVGPGLASRSLHLDLKYEKTLSEHFDISLNGYYDTNELRTIVHSSPTTSSFLMWNEDDVGAIAQLRYSYVLAPTWNGNLTFGLQIDGMRLLDSNNPSSLNGDWTGFNDNYIADPTKKPLLERGREVIYSSFLQLKQHLGPTLIANIGVRYDVKERHKGSQVKDFSPRAALIFTPGETFDIKLSYAQSFVDAPYWYRYNSIPSYQGASDLTPEHLRSLQITPGLSLLEGKLKNALTLFYNDFTDLIYRAKTAVAGQNYRNAGQLRTAGVENELSLNLLAFKARFNVTYQHLVRARDYDARGDDIFNVPKVTSNLVLDFNPLYSVWNKLWLNLTGRYVGKQVSPIFLGPLRDENLSLPSIFLFDAGIRLTNIEIAGFELLSVDATVHNLLNKKYAQGGSVDHPYPQPGRWFMANLTLHFPR